MDAKTLKELSKFNDHLIEYRFYELARNELETNSFDPAAKIKAMEEANGDELEARAFYVKHRVSTIRCEVDTFIKKSVGSARKEALLGIVMYLFLLVMTVVGIWALSSSLSISIESLLFSLAKHSALLGGVLLIFVLVEIKSNSKSGYLADVFWALSFFESLYGSSGHVIVLAIWLPVFSALTVHLAFTASKIQN